MVSLGSWGAWEALYMSAIMIGLVESLARIARRVAGVGVFCLGNRLDQLIELGKDSGRHLCR